MIYVILAIILLIFLLIVSSFLLVPFHISLNLFKRGSLTQGSFCMSWLGIRLIRRKIPSEEGRKEKEKFYWGSIPEMTSLFAESFPYLMNILNAAMKSISIKRFSCDVVMGLDSPADTAVVSGYLWSLASIINIFPKVYLSVKPDFQERRLDGSMMVELKVRLLRIVPAFIRAFFKKPVRQLFGKMRR
ncbi:MAG: DUF2953 domain-containing protein [archaeon]|nr:DUF2953 domain-containing protein [archaeon]MCP8306238.1 DUF2953 domain-containing protein [archaeon]